jgi:colanic acid/amylovoran biosynthesis protein
VLVVNQHGDNIGDEAATRAMLSGLDDLLAGARFTILHQFREQASEIETPHEVRWIPLVLRPAEAARLASWVVMRSLGLGGAARRALGSTGRAIIDAYEQADLVVSAPGGPYFGDPYWSHEPVHWAYVWLARWMRVPCALYAPSAGPFRIRPMNPFRRWTYRCFEVVTVREDRSAEHLRALLGGAAPVEVTADSALQEQVDPADREAWLLADGQALDDRFLLVVAAIDYSYPGDPDPGARRRRYDESIAEGIRHVVQRMGVHRTHVAFMPQLHSQRHSDAAYLRSLGERLAPGTSWEVVEDRGDSDVQRARFAAADLVIAGRYHPAVFAVSAGVPVLCIPYEHKATGLMEAAGQHRFVLQLDEVTPERVVERLDDLVDRREEVAAALRQAEPELRRRARRTSELVAALISS